MVALGGLLLPGCQQTANEQPADQTVPRVVSESSQPPARAASTPKSSASAAPAISAAKSATGTSQPIPPGGLRLYGRVLTDADKPISGARVEVVTYDHSGEGDEPTETITASAVSDTEGRYSVTTDTLTPNLSIRAKAQGFINREYSGRMSNPPKGTAVQHDFRLFPAQEISGVVVDETSAPIAGARVTAEARRGDRNGGSAYQSDKAITGSDGRFRMSRVLPGGNDVTAALEFSPVTKTKNDAPTTSVTLIVNRGATARVTGRVLDNDSRSPVADTTVTIAFSENLRARSKKDRRVQARTGPEGTFDFPRVPADEPLYPSVEHAEFVVLQLTPADNTLSKGLRAGTTQDLEVLMYPGHTVTGRVTNAQTAEPLGGVAVSSNSYRSVGAPVKTTTDADGRYTLKRVPLGTQSLLAALDNFDFQSHRQPKLRLTTETLTVTYNMTMQPKVRIGGRVLRDDGVPADGAQFRMISETSSWPIQFEYVAPGGWFEASVPAESTQRVFAKAPGYGATMTDTISVGTKDTTGIEVKLKAATTIGGIAILPDKKPAVGATINANLSAQSAYNSSDIPMAETNAGANGQFLIKDIPTDTKVSVRAYLENYPAPETQELWLKPKEQKLDLEFLFEAANEISGVFVTEKGEPIVGTFIGASPSDGRSSWDSARTDKDGRFTLKGLRKGKYNVQGQYEVRNNYYTRGAEAKDVPTGTKDLRLVVSVDSVAVEVRLISGVTKQPVTDAEFTADGTSEFVRDAANPSLYRGTIPRNGYSSFRAKSPTAGSGREYFQVRKDTPSPHQVTIELMPSLSVTGRIVADGPNQSVVPVADTKVSAANSQFIDGYGGVASAMTNAEGRFTLKEVESKGVSLSITPPAPYKPIQHQAFSIPTSNPTHDLGDIYVGVAGALEVTVVDGAGRTLQDKIVEVRTQDFRGTVRSAATGNDGIARFSDMPESSVQITCEKVQSSARIAPGAIAKARIVLGDASIIVTSVLPAGVTSNYCYGEAMNLDTGEFSRGAPKSNVIYELPRLAPGRYKLNARAQTEAQVLFVNTSTVEVAAGETKNVTVTFEAATLQGRVMQGTNPAPRADVTGRIKIDSRVSSGIKIKADNDGRFTLRVPPSTINISARASDGGIGIAEPITIAANQTRNIEIVIPAETGAIRSTTVDFTTGRPITAAPISIMRGGASVNYNRTGRDAQGTILVEKLPVGRYEVSIGDGSRTTIAKHTVNVTAGGIVELTDVLQTAGSLSWRVRPATGAPVPADATLTPLDPNSLETVRRDVTEEGGWVLWQGILPGPYRADAQTSDGRRATTNITIRPGKRTDEESQLR